MTAARIAGKGIYPVTNRGDWLALRKQDVTASEVAALFGAHQFRTVLQVYAEKVGASKGQGDNPAMRRGRILEPGCIVALQELHPDWKLSKANEYLRDADLRIGATPDYYRETSDAGWIGDPPAQPWEPVECKTVSPEQYAQWGDGVPLAYQLQVVTQCKLMGAARGWIALLVDNRAKDFELFEVPAHDGAWAKIVEKVAAFWKLVESGQLPPIDFARDRDAIKALMPPKLSATALDLTGDNHLPELLAHRERCKAVIEAHAELLEADEAEIIAKMAGHEIATLDGYRITHKTQTRKAYTVKEATFPVLRVTKLKEKENAA